MPQNLHLTNARLVTADSVVAGTLHLADGRIAGLAPGAAAASGADCLDLGGDWLIPGLVELHTDNLEKHLAPRPGVRWPARAAVLAHDAQIAAAGITTVFDALTLGDVVPESERLAGLAPMVEALTAAQATGMFRVDHRLHLRCEVSDPRSLDGFERYVGLAGVGLVSIMDHTPGQRQFADIDKFRAYFRRRFPANDEAAYQRFLAERRAAHEELSPRHRRTITTIARDRGLALASHDDATPEHAAEAAADGMTIAEFPTTLAAAEASRALGLSVLVGGPNLVLGGSHSGNVAAGDLAARGLVDILSSDYVPASALDGAFRLARAGAGLDLPAAIRLASRNPALAAGLGDRGELAPGLRADLVQVGDYDGQPVVRAVWVAGRRVL